MVELYYGIILQNYFEIIVGDDIEELYYRIILREYITEIYYGTTLQNDITELYHGIILQNHIMELDHTIIHLTRILEIPRESLEPPWDLKTPQARPWDPSGNTPETPRAPPEAASDHENEHISTNL